MGKLVKLKTKEYNPKKGKNFKKLMFLYGLQYSLKKEYLTLKVGNLFNTASCLLVGKLLKTKKTYQENLDKSFFSTLGGNRTHTPKNTSLSRARLPIPPPRLSYFGLQM